MEKFSGYIKRKAAAFRGKWKDVPAFGKTVQGITVIELVLILVRNFTPYLGCVLCG